MSLPPVFSTSFYRLLQQGAEQLGVSRNQFAIDAMRHYLKEQERMNTPTAQVLPEELAEHMKEARRKLAQQWWDTLTKEERTSRARRAITARWAKKQDPD